MMDMGKIMQGESEGLTVGLTGIGRWYSQCFEHSAWYIKNIQYLRTVTVLSTNGPLSNTKRTSLRKNLEQMTHWYLQCIGDQCCMSPSLSLPLSRMNTLRQWGLVV